MALELENVKKIGELLGLSGEQQDQIEKIKKEQGGFVGEIAVKHGMIKQDVLDNALLKQARDKATAALIDINVIEFDGQQKHTDRAADRLEAHWGNKGVNPPADPPTVLSGISASANIAANIVAVVNDEKPELAKDEAIRRGVLASTLLARSLADPTVVLDEKVAAKWMGEAKTALIDAVEKTGHSPKDKNGKDIDLEEYVNARFSEIEAAVKVRSLAAQEKIQQQSSTGAPSRQQGEDLHTGVPPQAGGELSASSQPQAGVQQPSLVARLQRTLFR